MRGLILAVLALLFVAGDSGRYVPQLIANAHSALTRIAGADSVTSTYQSNINNAHSAYALLWAAAKQQSDDAQAVLVGVFEKAYARQFESSYVSEDSAAYWLEKLVQLNNAEAAWLLYQVLGDNGVSERLMRLAAIGEVAEAQIALAMSSDLPQVRETWLEKAAAQGYVPAQAALADWYLLHGEQTKAKPLLEATARLDMQSAYKYGRLLWDEGEFEGAKQHFMFASQQGHEQAEKALNVIKGYTIQTLAQTPSFDWSTLEQTSSCLQRIQPFATSLATIIRADSLYKAYQSDERLSSLSLCIAPPIWLTPASLSCDKDYEKSGVLGCDITPLAEVAKRVKFSHAVVVAEQGKANVQNGVMYLDISDAYSVFVHELAHFAGFADEYPIGRGMAKALCNDTQITDFMPPNLVVDSSVWYAPAQTVNNWLAIDPSAIIAKSKTCELIGKASYKPSRRVTFMEHHDSGVIPPLYLVLWEQQLHKQNIQRPISMNFFQAFHHRGKQKEAAHWLSQYEAFISPAH
ncbi:hypothetical protein D210916BOD24_13980 [Alteromonas sp. D210916BOD_24]|uniref:sel1 repeat family protein n=1 Tax=Alteromonas sp. D210916BOD_24 TaxID=3157618 RepID=UPI00399D2675